MAGIDSIVGVAGIIGIVGIGIVGIVGSIGNAGITGRAEIEGLWAAGCSVVVFLAPTSLSMTALGLGGSGRRSQRSFRGEQLVGLQRGRTSSRRGVLLETL